MSGARVRLPLVLIAVIVVHTSVLARVRVDGVAPDVMLLLGIAAGIVGGPGQGAVVGFAAGLALDLFLQTPLGLSALSFSLIGYAVGTVQTGMLRSSWWLPLATAFVASAAGEALYAFAGAVVGQSQLVSARLPVIVVVVAGLNAVLSPLAIRIMRWTLASPSVRTAY